MKVYLFIYIARDFAFSGSLQYLNKKSQNNIKNKLGICSIPLALKFSTKLILETILILKLFIQRQCRFTQQIQACKIKDNG